MILTKMASQPRRGVDFHKTLANSSRNCPKRPRKGGPPETPPCEAHFRRMPRAKRPTSQPRSLFVSTMLRGFQGPACEVWGRRRQHLPKQGRSALGWRWQNQVTHRPHCTGGGGGVRCEVSLKQPAALCNNQVHGDATTAQGTQPRADLFEDVQKRPV